MQCSVLPVGGCRELILGLTSWRKGDLTSWPGDIYGIELPGVMGGVGFPGRGELGYPGIARPGCEKDETHAQALTSAARLSLQSDFHNRYSAKQIQLCGVWTPAAKVRSGLSRDGEILTGSSYRLVFHQTHMHAREDTNPVDCGLVEGAVPSCRHS